MALQQLLPTAQATDYPSWPFRVQPRPGPALRKASCRAETVPRLCTLKSTTTTPSSAATTLDRHQASLKLAQVKIYDIFCLLYDKNFLLKYNIILLIATYLHYKMSQVLYYAFSAVFLTEK